MRKVLYSIILFFFLAVPSLAGNPPRAKWIGNPPAGNRSLYFVVVHNDASSSIDGARIYSLKDLASNVERTDKVNVNEIYSDKNFQRYNSNGKIDYIGSDDYSLELQVEGTASPIHSRRVDEYWRTIERGGMPVLDYYAIYAVEKIGSRADFSNIKVSNSYGIQYMWRSILVPGWGQMFKGSYTKGGIMMGGTLVAAAGIIYTESQRSDYVQYMNQTHDANIIRSYQTKVNQFATIRNICIGGAAAIYIWNIVDALVSPGASHIIFNNDRVSMSPTTYQSGGVGISTTYNF